MQSRRSGFFGSLSVPARLRLAGVLALLGLGATFVSGFYGLRQGNADLSQSMTATSAVLHQKHADMMHDALRADVLSAIVLGPEGTAEEKQALIADLRAHGAEFTNALSTLDMLDLDPAVRELLVILRPHLDDYLQTAELVIYGGLEGRQSGLGRMPAFLDAFAALETEMGQLGELIEARGAAVGAQAQSRNRTLISVLAGAALLAAMTLILSNFFLSRSITRPLQRVRTAIVDLARSHMGGRDLPRTAGGTADEMTEIAHYLDLVGERLREAIAMEQTISRSQAEQHRVVSALSVGLQNLSTGNLSAPISAAFPPEYEDLRANFNLSLDRLNQTIARVIEASRSIRQRADGLSGATGDLSQRTENQAATLEETAAALDLLTSNVKAAADGAREVEVIVQAARKEAEISGKVVQDAVTAMTGIEQSSQQISQIIGVIEDIAFQTNLLALNAGVEAARAGDAGRGFAVVASEVRALAQRSSDASRQIKGLITSSTALVERGVDSVDSAGRALTSMAGQVAHISTLVSGIAAASAEQSTGLAEVNIGVTHLDQVAQKNATMVEESMSVTRALQQDAVGLDSLVSQFSILSGAHDTRDAA